MISARNIGKYLDINLDKKALKLSFSLPTLEVINFWSRCGLIANFGSSYLVVAHSSEKNIANSLSFIMNELLENAVKYAVPRDSILELSLLQKDGYIVIDIGNPIHSDRVESLIEMAQNLIDPDYVNAKYIDILTMNVKKGEKSGIGLLTIVNFYQASLSFRIGTPPGDNQCPKFYIQAKINIEEL